jgi:hypothetical protein
VWFDPGLNPSRGSATTAKKRSNDLIPKDLVMAFGWRTPRICTVADFIRLTAHCSIAWKHILVCPHNPFINIIFLGIQETIIKRLSLQLLTKMTTLKVGDNFPSGVVFK